jgi:hypothetical protein
MSGLLRNASISFHTNDEDKDDDTHITVTMKDKDNIVSALISNDFGHFDDHSDTGPYALTILNPSSRGSVQSGSVTIHIDPNGHDTWRFNFFLLLRFSDGKTLSGGANNLELTQDRREQTFGIDGIVNELFWAKM